MRYRFLKRVVIFLICVSVVLILSISKWSAKDTESILYESVKEIAIGRSFAGVRRQTSESNDEASSESTTLEANDGDYLVLVESVGSTSDYEKVANRHTSIKKNGNELQRKTKPGLQASGVSLSSQSGASGGEFTQSSADGSSGGRIWRRRHKKKVNGTYQGFVNVHIWEEWCGYRVLDLRRNKHFPLYPDIRRLATRLYLRHGETQYGQRIFGYIHPPGTGNYVLAVSSDDSSEVWLSISEDPDLIRKVAMVEDVKAIAHTLLGEFNKYKGQMSKPIYLEKGKKYYIEILHKQHAYKEHILVAWKGPHVPVFKVISSRYLSAYFKEDDISNDVTKLAEYTPETAASFPTHLHSHEAHLYTFNRSQYTFGGADSRDDFHKVPFVDRKDVVGLFPACEYRPSYLVDFKVKRYEGVTLIHDTAIYPDDLTELSHMYSECETRESDSHGNDLDTVRESGTAESIEEVPKTPSVFLKIYSFLSNVKSGLKSYISVALPTRNPTYLTTNVSKSMNYSSTASQRHAKSKHKLRPSKSRKSRRRKNRLRNRLNDKMLHKNLKATKAANHKTLDALKFLRQRLKRDGAQVLGGGRRKLLSISSQTFKPIHYDVDDEGLPNSHRNKRLARPIFVPIQGVENETLSFRSFSSMPRRGQRGNNYYVRDRNSYYYEETSPNSRNKTSNRIYINPEVFKLKSAREVMQYYRIFKSSIYQMMKELPRPDTWKFRQRRSECKNDGNLLLNEQVAQSVVKKVMKGLDSRNKGKYILKKIINVEENHDVINGDRYLVELDLQIKDRGEQSFRFSRYLYQPIGSLDLCEPKGLQWDPHSTVHVIIPVKNQGRWVQHFIHNMEKIYLETFDNHLNIIIVDFNSSDIDIENCFKRSKLPRYRIVHLDGPFQRALGIQAGADLVKNPHDIIFTCDLHLEIPSHLIDSIRKHCIEGRMAFAPVVVRLECGYTPDLPYGLWEIQGYGLFAVCKSDFDRIGGMNTKEFKTKWGGEDWEMLDRVLSHGIEVERLRIPKFYHYHHSKKRMWVSRGVDDETL